MSIENPLGMRDLLVNTVIGSVPLFAFISIIFFAFLAARFRMPGSAFAIMMVIFAILFSVELGAIYIIILVILGIVVFGALSKIFSK